VSSTIVRGPVKFWLRLKSSPANSVGGGGAAWVSRAAIAPVAALAAGAGAARAGCGDGAPGPAASVAGSVEFWAASRRLYSNASRLPGNHSVTVFGSRTRRTITSRRGSGRNIAGPRTRLIFPFIRSST
jgi:hypothetical protein